MALNTNYGKVSYTITNTSKEYTFNFKIYEESDVRVYVRTQGEIPNDNADILQTNEYTVTIDGDNGGLIVLNDVPPLNGNIVMLRDLPLDREFNYTPNGGIYSHALNEDQDYQTYLVQDQRVFRHSSLSFAKSAWGGDFDPKVDEVVPNGYLKINADGSGISMDTTVSENAAIVADNIDSVNTVADDINNVNTTATNISDVNKVGGDIGNVNTVADNIDSVNTCDNSIIKINTCSLYIDNINTNANNIISINSNANNMADIIDVSDNEVNITAVANNNTDITTIASIEDDITTTASMEVAITTVNDNETNINIVSTDIDNVNQVGNNIDNVIAAGDNETNINTVSTNIVEVVHVSDNMATVSETMNGIDDFNGTYYRSLSQAPTIGSHPTLTVGDMYFNNIDDMMKVYTTDSVWQDVSPTVSNIEGVGTPYEIVVLPYVATAGQTVFTAPSTATDLVIVNINGKTLSESDYTSDGSDITLNVGATLDDDVIVQVITTTTVYHEIISTDSQTVYSITFSPTAFVNIFLNGRLLTTDNYVLTTNTVTLNSGASIGDVLTLTEVEVSDDSNKTEYIATAAQTSFEVIYTIGTDLDDVLNVYLGGRLLPITDYTATNGTEIVLTVGATLNDNVVITKMVPVPAPTITTYGVYSKPQVDEMLELKADKADTYIKSEVYNKTEIDSQPIKGIVQIDNVLYDTYQLNTITPTTNVGIIGMNLSITPTYTTSKFKIYVRLSALVLEDTSYNFVLNITRDGVRVNNTGTDDKGLASFGDDTNGAHTMTTVEFTTLDTQTNVVGTPIIYQLTMRSNDDETIDRSVFTNQGNGLTGVSEIIIEEIK